MQVLSFTGKSGTGKSFQANAVAQSRNIDAIIDDGLLIYKGQIVAGTSAKKCASKAGAMRIALFNRAEHRNEVINAIVRYQPEKIMIIGTSDKMTNIIAKELGLHEPEERIYIEQVTTADERKEADYHRNVQGEHVIPAPMGQLKRDFAGYFMNPLRMIRDRALGNESALENPEESEMEESERTVVRPQYSYFGTFTISEQVLRDIVAITAKKYQDCVEVLDRMGNGKQMNMVVTIDVRVLLDENTIDTCMALQSDIHRAVESMTSFSVDTVNIRIKDVRRA